MQAASGSCNKTYGHPIYPFQVIEAKPPVEEQIHSGHLPTDLEKINNNTLFAQDILRRLNVPYETEMLKAICTIAHSTVQAVAHVIKPFDTACPPLAEPAKFLETSIVVVPHGEGKRVYVVRKDGAIKEDSKGKISKCFMLTFDKDNSLKEVRSIVRHAFRFNNDDSLKNLIVRRQLACMQALRARPDLFAEDFDFVEAKSGKIYVYQERAAKDLLDVHNADCKINKLANWLHLVKKVVEAVHYMHSKGFAHCDLKLENILAFGNQILDIKLSDFGFSSCPVSDIAATKMRSGSREWAAPEILTSQGESLDLMATDIWSLGHILYIFLNGKPALIFELLSSAEDKVEESKGNKNELQTLSTIKHTLEKIAQSVQEKLTSPPVVAQRQQGKPDCLMRRQLYCILLKFEPVFNLLQTMSNDNFAKLSICSQLDHRRALIDKLSEIKHLMDKAAISRENPPPDPLFQTALGINISGERPWQKCKRIINFVEKSLTEFSKNQTENGLQLLWSQCVQISRLVATTPFSVQRIQHELRVAQQITPLLEDASQYTQDVVQSYLARMSQEVNKEATCLQEAPQAMMRFDPKSRLDLQTLLKLIQQKIDARAKAPLPAAALTPPSVFVPLAPTQPPPAAAPSTPYDATATIVPLFNQLLK